MHRMGRKEVKTSLFVDDMILHTWKPRFHQRWLEMISKFSDVVRHRQYSVVYFYRNSEAAEKKSWVLFYSQKLEKIKA